MLSFDDADVFLDRQAPWSQWGWFQVAAGRAVVASAGGWSRRLVLWPGFSPSSAPARAASWDRALSSALSLPDPLAGQRVGLPGGPNLEVVGAAAAAGMRFVLTRTETAAVIMAATYADLTGLPGGAVVTRGPGLASAVNGITHAALDRLPVVVIADTVRSADAGRISHQRLDQAALGRAVAKTVVTVGRDRTSEAAAGAVRLALMPPRWSGHCWLRPT